MTTLFDKTDSPTLGLDKRVGLPGLNIILGILLLVTMLFLPVGGHAIHCVGGILMLIGCSVHLALHGRWIKAVILETPKNVTPTLCHQRRLFLGMLFSGFLCGLSGLAALPAHIHGPHTFPPMFCCGMPIHVLSGLAFVGLNINHLVLHRNWFRKNLTTFFTAPGR